MVAIIQEVVATSLTAAHRSCVPLRVCPGALRIRSISDKEKNLQRQMKTDRRLTHFSRHGPVSQSERGRGPGSLPDGDEP